MMEQDARVELHEKQPGIENSVSSFVREDVVSALGETLGKRLADATQQRG